MLLDQKYQSSHKPISKMKFNKNPTNQVHCSPALLSIFILFLCKHGSVASENLSNQTDHLALLEFKQQITNDPNGFFDSWNNSHHFCKWRGITCGVKHQRVVDLNLNGQSISGTISPHIGNLSFLRSIDLGQNSIYGQIPRQISQLFRLRYLILSNNTLGGRLPANLSRCSDLLGLYLYNNQLMGSIPEELGSLKKLQGLHLGRNNFTGFIPRSFSNLSSLVRISIFHNNVEGTIPNELGQLTNLTVFTVAGNNLSGTIPSSFYNISGLSVFYVTINQLTGTLPHDIGLTLPNLKEFGITANNFYGGIPVSFCNASQLQVLDIAQNKFTGQVPAELGHLKHLQWLNVEYNLLGSNATNDLSFIESLSNCTTFKTLVANTNNFGGEIPSSIGNCSVQFQMLSLVDNWLTGKIPSVLENLGNLYSLDLSYNLLSGSIPSSFGKFENLQALNLQGNKLSNQIPSSLGNISLISLLDLSDNMLRGNIPESLGYCEHLIHLDMSENKLIGSIPGKIFNIFTLVNLDLSGNSLAGSLPANVGNLENINALDVSRNNLTGSIPETIGECLSLEYLSIQSNFFHGVIPTSLTALKGIRKLDLSRNNLSGKIPEDMEKLIFLYYFNISFNNFEGEVPKIGVFENASAISVLGNSGLCGGIEELKLQKCQINVKKPILSRAIKIVIIAFAGVLFLVLIITLFLVRRNAKSGLASTNSMIGKLLRVSYHELYRATEGFSSRNLIGSGCFGSVYQGKLNQEGDKLVAVKVLNLENRGASKSFVAECRALRNIRHRNLVKILTYCSSIDHKHNQFKALVYEFMANGSLDTWLRPQVQESPRRLGLLERLNVAIDVANAIHYLHDLCEPSIIHCDIKPSNILLDNELIAHVGDFGLARLLFESIDNFAQEQSSSMGIKGSIGYTAPEYGMGGEASKYGDVYSYGVLLLEMITGRRPTNEIFKDDLNLHNYVKTALEEQQVMRTADATLVATGEAETEAVEDNEQRVYVYQIEDGGSSQECITAILKIGVVCTSDSPKERMCMNQVLMELRHIKTRFLDD